MSPVKEPKFFLTGGPPPRRGGGPGDVQTYREHIWHYTRLGRYGEQLDHLLTVFPREQVFVLRYRDLLNAPAQALDTICSFLGVRPGIISQVPRENVTAHPEHSPSHRAVSLVLRSAATAGRHLPGAAGTALTQPLERYLQRSARPR